MKKKILIIDNSIGMTGAFKVILHISNALRDVYDFYFAIPPASKHLHKLLLDKQHLVVPVKFLELRKNASVLFYFPRLIINSIRIASFCKRENISIIHVNDLYNMAGMVVKWIRPSSRLIYHVRLRSTSYGNRMFNIWINLIHRFADQIIVVSESVRQDIGSYRESLKVKLIYDFIELPERHTEMKTGSMVRFLYPANFTEGKGHPFAIQAIAQAISVNSTIRLTFAGGDFGLNRNIVYREKLEADVASGGLQEYIDFQDFSENIEHLMRTHDVVLNFSESESFSMTCYEALYYGRAVIASDSGGPAELIEHNKTGLLVPIGDVPEMTQAILELATDATKRQRLAELGRTNIHEKRLSHNPVHEYNKVYQII